MLVRVTMRSLEDDNVVVVVMLMMVMMMTLQPDSSAMGGAMPWAAVSGGGVSPTARAIADRRASSRGALSSPPSAAMAALAHSGRPGAASSDSDDRCVSPAPLDATRSLWSATWSACV